MVNVDRIKQLEKFLQEDPDDPFTIYALAIEHLSIKKQKARELFDQLLAEHPNYLGTYYHAASLYDELGKRDEAERIYKRGIELTAEAGDHHALRELKSAYQNFLFDDD